jgi:hypothetical protein
VTKRSRAHARPPTVRGGRLAVFLVLAPVFAGLTIGTISATHTLPVRTLSAEDAARSGSVVTIVAHPELAPGLAEVRLTGDGPSERLLAIGPDAQVAAVAERLGRDPTDMILARADGTQLRTGMAGLIGASFAPDGTWLAVLDGLGRLWRIDAGSGSAHEVADGPFIGSPVVESSGSILALRVSSVEAPFVSRLVRVAHDGTSTTLSDDALVYGVQPLDGGLAVIAHRATGTVVTRLDLDGSQRTLLVLGPDAVNVAVARSGDAVAFERRGAVYVQAPGASAAIRAASGGLPRFANDGESLLVDTAAGSDLVDLEGRTVASFSSQAAFETCGAECGS